MSITSSKWPSQLKIRKLQAIAPPYSSSVARCINKPICPPCGETDTVRVAFELGFSISMKYIAHAIVDPGSKLRPNIVALTGEEWYATVVDASNYAIYANPCSIMSGCMYNIQDTPLYTLSFNKWKECDHPHLENVHEVDLPTHFLIHAITWFLNLKEVSEAVAIIQFASEAIVSTLKECNVTNLQNASKKEVMRCLFVNRKFILENRAHIYRIGKDRKKILAFMELLMEPLLNVSQDSKDMCEEFKKCDINLDSSKNSENAVKSTTPPKLNDDGGVIYRLIYYVFNTKNRFFK